MDTLFYLSFPLLCISFLQDLNSSTRNATQLTCISRRFSLIYYLLYFLATANRGNWLAGSDDILVGFALLVLTLQSLGFASSVVLAPCLVLAPLGLVVLLFKWSLISPGPCLSVLLVMHGIVVPGFWIGVTFLDRHSDASVIIQELAEKPWKVFCGMQYQSILIDHGGYNIFVCCHILRNFRKQLSFGFETRIYFTLLCILYFFVLFLSYRIRSVRGEELRRELGFLWLRKSLPQKLVQPAAPGVNQTPTPTPTPNSAPPWCDSCAVHSPEAANQIPEEREVQELRAFLQTESEWTPLLSARKEILAFYHRPRCKSELDKPRVAELLSRAVSSDESTFFLSTFPDFTLANNSNEPSPDLNPVPKQTQSLLRSFVAKAADNPGKLKAWIRCYEYLAASFPYDVLYPYSSPEVESEMPFQWQWSYAATVALWVYLLGSVWLKVLSLCL